MLCEKCKKNEANVFYEETINGVTRSYSLCRQCAAELKSNGGFSDILPFPSFTNIHDQLFGGLFGSTPSNVKERKSCQLCGSAFDDLKRNGKAGCPQCYNTFRDELGSTILSIHGNVKHTGRAPAKFKQKNEKQLELKRLKNQLKEAISAENFELAVTLRDKIHTIENDCKGGTI